MRPELDEGGWVIPQVDDQAGNYQHVLGEGASEQYPIFVKRFDESQSHGISPFTLSRIPPKLKLPDLERA